MENGRLLFQKYRTLHYKKNVKEGKFTFIDGRESPEEKRKVQPLHIDPGLYPSIVDIVVAMNDEVRKRIGAQNMSITDFMYQ